MANSKDRFSNDEGLNFLLTLRNEANGAASKNDRIRNSRYVYFVNNGEISEAENYGLNGESILLFKEDPTDSDTKTHVAILYYDPDTGVYTLIQAGGNVGSGVHETVINEDNKRTVLLYFNNWASMDLTQEEWETVFDEAETHLGDSYSPSPNYVDTWDCSGFVLKAMSKVGYEFHTGASTIFNRGKSSSRWPKLSESSSINYKEDIMFLQKLLCDYGADIGVSGTFDDDTKRAVQWFQDINDLPITGTMDVATWEVMFAMTDKDPFLIVGASESLYSYAQTQIEQDDKSNSPTLKKDASGEDVKEDVKFLQILLNQFGTGLRLEVNGIFDDATYEAIQNYQGENDLFTDGIVGGNTWKSLKENLLTLDLDADSEDSADIKFLQELLNRSGAYPQLEVNGRVDDATYEAVKSY